MYTSRQGYTSRSLCSVCRLYTTTVSVRREKKRRTRRENTQKGDSLTCAARLFRTYSSGYRSKWQHSLERTASDNGEEQRYDWGVIQLKIRQGGVRQNGFGETTSEQKKPQTKQFLTKWYQTNQPEINGIRADHRRPNSLGPDPVNVSESACRVTIHFSSSDVCPSK